MEKNDGGPVIPVLNTFGITLRDWFSGMAMMGSLSNQTIACDIETYRNIPFRCYEIADAMLKEREKETIAPK